MQRLTVLATVLLVLLAACTTQPGDSNQAQVSETPAPTVDQAKVEQERKQAEARNADRELDVIVIVNAIKLYVDAGNKLEDIGAIPACSINSVGIGNSAGYVNLYQLVPDFLESIPADPLSGSDADTGYTICTVENKVLVTAPGAELEKEISETR